MSIGTTEVVKSGGEQEPRYFMCDGWERNERGTCELPIYLYDSHGIFKGQFDHGYVLENFETDPAEKYNDAMTDLHNVYPRICEYPEVEA